MAAENSKKEEVHKTLWAETADFRFEQRKEEWSIFTKLFNDNPKTAYEFLSSSGLGNEKEPSHLAIIFHNCSSLDKQLIGKELATKYDVLVSFLNYFAFAGMDLLSALREFLPMFQLPGEAQKIDIIFEAFATRYTSCNPDFPGPLEEEEENEKAPSDIAYQLVYSMIMLNTDQHNATVKDKMTLDTFLRTNRGCGAPNQMLIDIFHSIQKEPLSSERKGGGKNTKGAQEQGGKDDETEIAPAKKGFFSSWMNWD